LRSVAVVERLCSVNEHLQRLRRVALIEGISWLVLLLIAMPLKYFAGQPMAVSVCGWIHGALFLWYIWQWQLTRLALDWPPMRSVRAFVSALLPGGFWVLPVERG
jgi:integral membrane protein